MHSVVIYRCPVTWTILDHTDHVVEALREDGVDAVVADGRYSEFDVEVDHRLVVYKNGGRLPSVEQVRVAVEDAIWVSLPEVSEHEALV
jgi:hypothetical protein